MKDEEFGEIPQETLMWFVEPGQEKALPHLPIPPRSFALAIGPVVWGLMGDVLNLKVSPTFATPYLEFSESWYRRRKGLVLQAGSNTHLTPNA